MANDDSYVECVATEMAQDDLRNATDCLVDFCHGVSKEMGWHNKPREVGTMLMLMVSELAEAMEGDRKGLKDDKLPQYDMITVELADCIIRICDFAGVKHLPLGEALADKLVYNTQRPDHQLAAREAAGGKKY